MTPDERIAAYKEAYAAANEGREIEVHYQHGWYSIFRDTSFGYSHYRVGALNEMIERLRARRKAKEAEE